MPQKVNPDPLELIRANYHVIAEYESTIKGICSNLISGYHRDYQLTKGPVMKSMAITLDLLKIMSKIINELKINEKKMKEAVTDEIYATEKAYRKIKN